MKNKLYLLILLMLAASVSQAQNIVLEFNANHTCTQVNLDSILIENLTQGDKMVLYYPDNTAVLVITDIGVFDPEPGHLFVSQNYPNPFSALTYIDVYLAMPDMVSLNVYDLKGRTIARREDKLEEGMHRFSFSAGAETTYILNVTSSKQVEKRIMLQMGTTGPAVSELSYMGSGADNVIKTAPKSSYFSFTPGDDLRFTGYVTDIAGNMDYGVIDDAPETSTEYLFDIANNPPNQPSEISGENDVPENATGLVYEVDETAGLTYLWSVPEGWEITQGQGSHAITVNAGSVGGEISVKAENNCGLSQASVLSVDVYFNQDIIYGDGVTDIDGNEYITVIIGNQEWMAENLRVTRYNNGDDIPTGLSNIEWANISEGASAIYNNDENMLEAYGKLYNWFAVDDSRDLCPVGWSVPSDADWLQLADYVVSQGFPNEPDDSNGTGNALKSCRQIGSPLDGCDTSVHPRWNPDDTHYGFDVFGFSALPGGRRTSDGSYDNVGASGTFWSAAKITGPWAWLWPMISSNGDVGIYVNHLSFGYSIRCLRDTFDPSSINLNLAVNPSSSGSVSGAGVYEAGEEVDIAAVANEGWSFANWSGDTEYLVDANAANTIVTIPAYNISLTAKFQVEHDPDIIYGDGVTDIDGNEYATVIIGNQEWMTENLRVSKYNNSDVIPTGLSDNDWTDTTEGAYAVYDNDEDLLEAYGKLYNWYAVNDARYLCPEGWHVPTDTDWTQLVDYVVAQGFPNGMSIQNGVAHALKSCRQVDSPVIGDCNTSQHPRWNSSIIHYGVDNFGFSALPGGTRDSLGNSVSIGNLGYWWSATESSYSEAWQRGISSYIGNMFRGQNLKIEGLSVRCLRYTDDQTTFSISLDVNPSGAGSVTGAGLYEAGEEIMITAVADEDWFFVNWVGDTDYVDDPLSANATVLMPAKNISLSANLLFDNDPDIIYGDGVTDIDGNEYITVIIGNQEWMVENLRVSKYNNSDDILTDLSDNNWEETTDGAYAIYPHANINGLDSDAEVVLAYGKLYNWYAVDDARGLCPAGWNVPSHADWTQLVDYVTDQGFPSDFFNQHGTGNALKSCRQINSPLAGDCDTSEHPRWNPHSTHFGFDEFGFSAFPGGFKTSTGVYDFIGGRGFWQSATGGSDNDAFFRYIYNEYGHLGSGINHNNFGMNVRCLRYTSDQTSFSINLGVSPTGSGTTTGSGVYEEGEEVVITADVNEGWYFVNWFGDIDYVDDQFSANATVSMPAHNISLTAKFMFTYDPDIIYGDGVTDIDGNEYVTVIIGDQEWMAENLRVSRYNNGDDIPTDLSNAEWSNITEGSYAIYPHYNVSGLDSDAEMVTAYGKLYNWFAVNDSRGLCPTGWSVPSDADWTQLVDYVASQDFPNSNINGGAGNALKSCRQFMSPIGGD